MQAGKVTTSRNGSMKYEVRWLRVISELLCVGLLASLLPRGDALRAPAAALSGASVEPAPTPAAECERGLRLDHPLARITNGRLALAVYLPDPKHGYYRGPRFDWSGIVGCASLEGHSFFGEWFSPYEPTLPDAVTGPAEEFRRPSSELGYEEAAPGGLFVKIGVGVLRRVDASPYRFGVEYPIVDTGRWTVKARARTITFRQDLHTTLGYSYRYEKVLALDRKGNVLSLRHRLQNLGARPIDTEVYDHDFYMLDGKPTGPGMEVGFRFVPLPDKPLPEAARIEGSTVRLVAPLVPGHGLGAYLTGFSGAVSDYDLTVEDRSTGLGVEQTSDSPIARFYLWATPRTLCPEAYLAIHLPPGGTQSWTLHYRFFTHPGG